MKKILLAFLVVLILAAGAKWYKGYMLEQEAAEVAVLMKEATDMVARQASFFKDPHGETHAEVVAYAVESVRRTGLLVDQLMGRQGIRDKQLVDHGVEYLKTCQEASRFMRQMVMDKAEVAATLRSMERSVDTMQNFISDQGNQAKRFHADVAGYGAAPLIQRSKEAQMSLDSSVASLGAALSRLVAIREARPKRLPLHSYVSNEMVTGITFSTH